MRVESGTDMAAYATAKAQKNVKDQVQVSILKESMKLTEKLMQELQKNLQPPKNPQGKISIYA